MKAAPVRQVLFNEPFLLLTYDMANELLHAQWQGRLTLDTVRAGAERVLDAVRTGQYRRLLNDNSAIVSLDLTEEEQRSYQIMDRLFEAGLHYLAWVYAPVHQGRSYAENSIAVTTWPLILTFEEYAPAVEWLQQAP
ncbi:hypothetical protein [Hymenobacter sp. 102]|uniref:hypothetical protein n=1 Tax=Hymenobacter sp. 102 TaxID=3403152 RepID=UPI003CE7A491